MNENLLSIGKMARLNHVSIQTLRLYDELGILTPRFVNPDNGYRYYDIQQNARLDMIAYMKELGMSLTEIADVLKKEDLSLIEEILARKNEQIHRQINALRIQHDAVERAISSIERYRKSPATGTITLEFIDQRYVWGIPCSENFYEGDVSSYEQVLSELRKSLLDRGFPQVHSYNVGTSIRQSDFENGSFLAHRVFIFSDRHLLEWQSDAAVVDSGMYACVYADSYDDEMLYASELLGFCRDHHYEISGDYICEVMTEFNVFDNNARSMFLRLQVPISFYR